MMSLIPMFREYFHPVAIWVKYYPLCTNRWRYPSFLRTYGTILYVSYLLPKVSVFPEHETNRCLKPLDWAKRKGNVVARYKHESGGHFAAVESPDILLNDIRTFWGNPSLSNVGSFGGEK